MELIACAAEEIGNCSPNFIILEAVLMDKASKNMCLLFRTQGQRSAYQNVWKNWIQPFNPVTINKYAVVNSASLLRHTYDLYMANLS